MVTLVLFFTANISLHFFTSLGCFFFFIIYGTCVIAAAAPGLVTFTNYRHPYWPCVRRKKRRMHSFQKPKGQCQVQMLI